MADFKLANELTRMGKHAEAELIYNELYSKRPLELYRQGLNFARRQLGKHEIGPQGRAGVKRRILFITAGLKGPTPGGGIATCFHSMIKNCGSSSDFQVSALYIAHPYYSKKDYDYWRAHYKKECNAELVVISVRDKDYGSQEMKRSFAILKFLMERERDFDVVVFHDFMGLAYYPLLAQKHDIALKNLQILISAHGNHSLSYHFGAKKVSSWNEQAVIYMEKEALRMAERVTSPSAFYRSWLVETFGVNIDRIKVLPNIIYADEEADATIDVVFKDPGRKLIVFYGRMERLKGLDVLLDAIRHSDRNGGGYNVLFAGVSTTIDGIKSKDYIERQLDGITADVKFTFNCSPTSLYNYVTKNNGVCVLPTLGENAPCIVVECILHAVPFLASDIPGIREMVRGSWQHTYLFRTGSAPDLRDKLEQLVPPPCPEVLSYDIEEVKKEWNRLLAEISNSRRKTEARAASVQSKVSVVIPTSNRPLLLEAAIRSIRAQTYTNIEIIIVDDASSDSNRRENQRISQQHGAQYLRSEDRLFKGRASNKGADAASGEFICFFDDDDIADERMIERYMTSFSANANLDVISGFASCFDHERLGEDGLIRPTHSSLALGGGLEVNLLINLFGKGTFIVRKDKFHAIGGYEVDDDAVPMVDYRFYIKAAAKGLNISIVPLEVYHYRKNSPNSLFYSNGQSRRLQFLAKKSAESIIRSALGSDVGAALSSVIWNISLPRFE